MLYWAEGGKTRKGMVRFSNSDPEMIKIMMAFFRKVCNAPKEKFRGYIHIHPHLNHKKQKNIGHLYLKSPLVNSTKLIEK